MIKKLLLVLLLSIPLASFGQQHVLFRDSTTIDSFRLTMWVRQLIPPAVPKINPFFDSVGSAYLAPNGIWWRHNGVVWQPLTTEPDSAVWATLYYVDSGLASISAGAVDTNNYISSIARLNREIDSVSNIIDSNNAIIYGSLSDLYDTKADKDTLGNFLLKSDTATLSNRINLKQNYSDTTTFDATRYYVDTAKSSIRSAYVPYTGATGNVDIGTHTITAKDGVFNHSSGSGTTLSVTKGGSGEALTVNKTSGSGNAMSVTGGVTQLSELHTTTPIADAYIASAATWNAKGNGTVTSIQLVGGTNVTITPTTAITTSGVYTISATGGGSSTIVKANEFNMLYKANGDTTIRGTTKVRVDTTDLRMEFAYDADTATVTTDPHGGVKMWGSNRMGMGAVRINDTVSIPAALQRSLNAQITSTLMPNTTVLTGAGATGNYNIDAPLSIMPTSSPLVTNVVGSYNSTIQHFNYTKLVITTQTSPNITAGIRTNSNIKPLGIICGNTKFSAGGGRGTFTFALPTYNSGQRIFVGYSVLFSQQNTDPTNFLHTNSGLGVGKDATDTELQFFHSNNLSVTPTKVSTGITPNAEDVYRVTVYVAPNSAYYIQLEVLNKNRITVRTFNPTTNVPAVSTKLYPMQYINNATTGAAIQYGFIYATEEIY